MKTSKQAIENLAKELSSAPEGTTQLDRGAAKPSRRKKEGDTLEEEKTSSVRATLTDRERAARAGDVAPITAEGSPVLKSASDTQRKTAGPVEGDSDLVRVNPRLVCLLEPRSEHAESYYRLRYSLESRRRSDSALVVGVTSPSEGDGKTLTAINLAGALAQDARSQVLLLDLDFRHKGDGLGDYLALGAARELGVVDWIQETGYGHEQFTHYVHQFNLHVMTAGSDPELPYELLKSSRLDDLIRLAHEEYDFVIFDLPQILRLPDTELISRLVDGFLIVVKADKTGQNTLEEALNQMTPDKVFGLVFNAVHE